MLESLQSHFCDEQPMVRVISNTNNAIFDKWRIESISVV
jgi:hypothetical protein